MYTIGLDVIAQTTFTTGGPQEGETLLLNYDGHGSTRILTDLSAAIAAIGGQRQLFAYDACGSAVGFDIAAAATSLLYSGEQFDQRVSMPYLRARYFDSVNGRFNRLDPYAGSSQAPLSLHKYQFAHANPVMGSDPTGKFLTSVLAVVGINAGFRAEASESIVDTGAQIAAGLKEDDQFLQTYLLVQDIAAISTAGLGAVFAGAQFFQRFFNGRTSNLQRIAAQLAQRVPGVLTDTYLVTTQVSNRIYNVDIDVVGRVRRGEGPVLRVDKHMRERDRWAQTTFSSGTGYHAGHLIPDSLGGPGGMENLVFMRGDFNKSDVATVENRLRDLIDHHASVHLIIEARYNGRSALVAELEYTAISTANDGARIVDRFRVRSH